MLSINCKLFFDIIGNKVSGHHRFTQCLVKEPLRCINISFKNVSLSRYRRTIMRIIKSQ